MGFLILALIYMFINVIKRARGCVGILVGVVSGILSGSISTGLRVSLASIGIGGLVGAIIGAIVAKVADYHLWKIFLGIVIVLAMALVGALFASLARRGR